MQYGGFLIEFTYKFTQGERYTGPYSTIEETTKIYEGMKALDQYDTIRIVRIVSNPSNPAWI